MEVRTFKLYNAKGEELDLMNRSHFFSEPSGLGFERDDSYRQIGDRFVLVSSKTVQGSIDGTIIMAPSSIYQNYTKLMQFFGPQPLRLKYTPYSGADYFRDVRLKKIEKSEIEDKGYMSCKASFTCLTPWYREIYASTKQPGKDLHWIWEVTFTAGFAGGQDMAIDLQSDSFMDSPVKLSISGAVTNPRWEQYVNGVKAGEGKVTTTVPAGDYLIINNTDKYDIGIYSAAGDLVRSAYENSDFTKDRFINLKNGRNTFLFSDDTGAVVEIKMEGRLYYESV